MNRAGERGSVSVVLAAVLLVTLIMVLAVADLGRVFVARSRARTAADAAALAAAQELAFPSGLEPSSLASRYAAANGGELSVCRCLAGTFEAVVEVRVSAGDLMVLPGAPTAVARSRAVVDLRSASG